VQVNKNALSDSSIDKRLTGGQIAGIVIGVISILVAVSVVTTIVALVVKQNSAKKKQNNGKTQFNNPEQWDTQDISSKDARIVQLDDVIN